MVISASVPPTGGSKMRLEALVAMERAPGLPSGLTINGEPRAAGVGDHDGGDAPLVGRALELMESASVARVSLLPAVMAMSAVTPPNLRFGV